VTGVAPFVAPAERTAPPARRPCRRYTPDEIIAALQQTRGLVAVAAERLGCADETVRRHVRNNARVAEALRHEREKLLDWGELALYRAVQNGEAWAVCFLLKTLGKSRGFVERQELTGADGGDIRLSLGLVDRVLAEADGAQPPLRDGRALGG
jgi:hypothetical protein